MISSILVLLSVGMATNAFPSAPDPMCANPPAKGLAGAMGGLFGMGGGATAETMPNPLNLLLQTPQSTKSINGPHKADGTGKFPAKYFTDSSLPGHTIYAPIKHTGEELPVLVWGNGACFSMGLMFQRFLTEIASHGFIVLANGGPSGGGLLDMFSSPSQLTQSIDWIYGGKDGGKYGKINKEKLAVAGQSCGGLESLSAAYHDDRVKYIGIFNSGLLNPARTCLLKEFKVPIAYFLGGPKDIAFKNGERDYENLPTGLPAVKVSLDAGHMATYYAPNAGAFGKAAVAYFKWVLKNDEASKKLFLDKPSPLVQEGWNVTSRNWS